MTKRRSFKPALLLVICPLLFLGASAPTPVDAGLLGKIGKAASKRVIEKPVQEMTLRQLKQGVRQGSGKRAAAAKKEVMRRDRARHATPVRPLKKPTTVHRYVDEKRARQEMRDGISPESHMTSNARRGRPPSPKTARDRYGLFDKPQVRQTIHLPAGHPVRRNKAIIGQPGWGELTSSRPVPPEAIRRVVPLK